MEKSALPYKEQLQEDFSIRHKVTQTDEKHSFHIHDELELLFVLSDGLQCTVAGKTTILEKNTLLLFNDIDLHHIRMVKPGSSDRYVVYFKAEYAAPLSTAHTDLLECFFFRPFPDPNLLPLSPEQGQEVLALLQRLEGLSAACQRDENSYGSDLRLRLCLAEFLLLVNSLYRKNHGIEEGSADAQFNTIYNIMAYLHKNYSQDISLDALSARFYINKHSLCSLFKRVTGTSVNQYLIHCRLVKAKELLLNRESVENVCAMVGYNNLPHFSRIFKQHMGQSPKQYQKSHSGSW